MKLVTAFKAIKRAKNIMSNLIHIVGHSVVLVALSFGMMSMFISVLLYAGASLTTENVAILLKHSLQLPLTWMFIGAILYTLFKLMDYRVIDLGNWKLTPKEQPKAQELPQIGKTLA